MTELKQKFKDYIKESKLSMDQKMLWGVFISKATPEEDEAVFEAISESEENLFLLTNHLRDKILEMEKKSF